MPLDKIILNTEAHPFPRFELGKLFKTGWERIPRDLAGNLVRPEKPQEVEQSTEAEKAKEIPEPEDPTAVVQIAKSPVEET